MSYRKIPHALAALCFASSACVAVLSMSDAEFLEKRKQDEDKQRELLEKMKKMSFAEAAYGPPKHATPSPAAFVWQSAYNDEFQNRDTIVWPVPSTSFVKTTTGACAEGERAETARVCSLSAISKHPPLVELHEEAGELLY